MSKTSTDTLGRLLLTIVASVYFCLHFFPILKSFPGIPGENLIVPVWLFLIIIFKPRVLFSREFGIILIFFVIHIVYLLINNYELLNPRTTQTLGDIFFALFFCISLYLYLKKENDDKFNTVLFWIITSSIIITGSTTIFAAIKNPYAVRLMIGNDDYELVRGLLSQNVGGYSFQYMVALISPLFIYAAQKSNKKAWYLPFIIGTLSVFFSQVVGIIIVHVFNTLSVYTILNTKSLKIYLKRVTLFSVIIFFSKEALGYLLLFFAEVFSSFEQIKIKFIELASLLLDGTSGNSSTVNTNLYQELFDYSVEGFLASPIVGGSGLSGGHHFWIDNLSEHGLVGTFPWVFLFIIFYKYIKRVFDKIESLLILNIILMFIIIDLTKNILIKSMPMYLFFIAPIIILHFRNKNKQNEY